MSAAERRVLINKEENTVLRVVDFIGIIPAITGKIELVYEGEQEGAGIVAQSLIGKSIRSLFLSFFPDPEKSKKEKENHYAPIMEWFGSGNTLDMLTQSSDKTYKETLSQVPGLEDLVKHYVPKLADVEKEFYMEFALHGLAEFSQISKKTLETGLQFKDLFPAACLT